MVAVTGEDPPLQNAPVVHETGLSAGMPPVAALESDDGRRSVYGPGNGGCTLGGVDPSPVVRDGGMGFRELLSDLLEIEIEGRLLRSGDPVAGEAALRRLRRGRV